MTLTHRQRRRYTAIWLAVLALALPRMMMPAGFMPAQTHEGRFTLIFCDPALRAAFGGHVHTHGHEHGGNDCPFAMSGGPALLAQFSAAAAPISVVGELLPVETAPLHFTRFHSAYGARAPPAV